MGQRVQIAAAEAVKHFKGVEIAVQVVKRSQVKGEDGKMRELVETKMADLRASHVMAGYDLGDEISITTIDGRRHVVRKDRSVAAAAASAAAATEGGK